MRECECECSAAVPWTAEAEAAEASRCARFSLGDIEHVVHETGISWEWLVEVSMRRVRLNFSLHHVAQAELHHPSRLSQHAWMLAV